MGLPDAPPRLDADSVRRPSRDLLLGHGLVDVVTRREGTRTRRLPPEGGVAVGDQVQGGGLLGEVERVLVAHV